MLLCLWAILQWLPISVTNFNPHYNTLPKFHKHNTTQHHIHNSARGSTLDDGDRFRQEMVAEETKLKVIRDKMVNDLKAKGVNPRYLSEMINVDVGKMLRR